GEAVMIKGPLSLASWPGTPTSYQVTLDSNSSYVYNATTGWIVGDSVLYFQGGLAPNEMHAIGLTNLDEYNPIGLSSITAFSSSDIQLSTPGPDSSYSASKRTIIGASVGGALATLLILALLGFLWRWRLRRNKNRDMYPERIARDPNGIDADKAEVEGYVAEPFVSSSEPSVPAQRRRRKVGPTVQSDAAQAEQPSSQEPPGDSNPRQNTSDRSAIPEPPQRAQNESTAGVVLDYELLAEHVVARLARPVGNEEQHPPEYAPLGPEHQ
ncbi:hypothetical protein FRC07_004615, partial [Ceratobasidium sp. 392]